MWAFLTVKEIPRTGWSSAHPLYLRPPLITLALMSFGLFVMGIGEALLIGPSASLSLYWVARLSPARAAPAMEQVP